MDPSKFDPSDLFALYDPSNPTTYQFYVYHPDTSTKTA
ncbi:hypothetical protein AB7M56_000233 [Bradyrhizobium elkanii]|jgi:hypothetical protein|nr:hypothetical protein [Bradyrhizobium elkanii]MCS3482262.1 hypothetical protein [Bradyrhizobium elkanii]MCS3525050.1 hypothetical protein [Bradyrhizobium elkanii]MCS4075737.1 hypothetical protein [Bradyrhizobium elkanii]MCS4085013.1 hypothetical protein [Bradyrhizobium elkanii]